MEKPQTKRYYCTSIREIPALIPSGRRAVVLMDRALASKCKGLFTCPVIEIESCEENKSFFMVEELTMRLIELEADRGSLLIVVGGGILSDLGGFLASIYFRGIDFGYIPTTMLSQVDASIGGKTGINVRGYKNILGVINEPSFTIFCAEFLETLPKKEIEAGIAEMLKTFILADRKTYFDAVDTLNGGNPYLKKLSSFSELMPFIRRAAEIKSEVVERDPYEKGERKLLNLGHTFAHALEKMTGISHGEAVSIGLALASKLSVKLRLLPAGEGEKIIQDLELLGMPCKSPVKPLDMIDIITKDKKRDGDTIQFILLESIGKAVIYPVTIDRLKGLLNDLS